MYVCFVHAFTKLRIDTLLQNNTMLRNRLSRISVMTIFRNQLWICYEI